MSRHRSISGFVALVAATTSVQCANKDAASANQGKNCKSEQALQAEPLRGNELPPKTIALTFDDGPGPRTKALSSYLKKEGIQAAFFVNGRSMGDDAADILQQLVADGHLVGNHTETHRSLTGVATATERPTDAEIIQELTETDAKIARFVDGDRFLFRPPFGDFDERTLATLANSPMSKYAGPIMWDVGDRMDEANGSAADWDCWQDGSDGKRIPMKECGDLYVTSIKRAGWGIVLMHDPYYNELDPQQEGTVEMVMYMVPILKQEGFAFIRVDRVPEIEALLPPLPAGDVPVAAPEGEPPGDKAPEPSPGDDPCK